MQVKNYYDLIVVGDQLSGYFLAAGAAQAGFRVLLVEGSATPTAVYEAPSGAFLADFNWEPLFGLTENGSVDLFLKSLGLYSDAGEIFPKLDPPLQLISPEYRVDFTYNASALAAEWLREVPRYGSALAKLADQSFNANFKEENLPFAKLIERLGLPVAIEKLGAIQLALYSALMPEELYCSAYRLSLQRAASGVRYVIGGKSALKERLLGRLQVYNGAIKRGAWAEEIVFENEKLAGVLLSSFEGFVRAPRVVGAMGSKRFLDLVPKALRPKQVDHEVKALRPRYWRFSFTLHVPEELVPEGMGQHLSYFDPKFPLEEENFIQLFSFPKGVYSGIPMGQRALLARVLIPFDERNFNPRYLSGVLKRSVQNLSKILPFLDSKKIKISPDPDALTEDVVFNRYFKFMELAKIPASLIVYDQIYDRYCERGVPMDWSAHGVAGLGFCSRDVNPLYGVYGEILAAKEYLDQMIVERAERQARERPSAET